MCSLFRFYFNIWIFSIKKKIQIVSAYIDILIARRIAKRRTLAYSSIKYTMFNLMKEIRDLSLIELAAEINKKIDDMEENFDDILNFSLRNRYKYKVKIFFKSSFMNSSSVL